VTPDTRHWRLCARVLDPWRRRACSCAELDPVLGPREVEALAVREAERLRAAGVVGEAK
jgi:hypothetical protein